MNMKTELSQEARYQRERERKRERERQVSEMTNES
jgi:hypothetical protein